MHARKGGAWRTITSGQAFINGAWRQISNGSVYIGGRWKSVCNFTAAPVTPTPPPTAPPPPPPVGTMTLAVSPSSASGVSSGAFVASQSVTATPTGGKSPYTYLWSITQSDGNSFTLSTPTSASTAVLASLGAGVIATCSIHCVCTDSTGLRATSADVPITLRSTGSPGPGVLP